MRNLDAVGFVFDDLWVQRFMLADVQRGESYRKALIAAVTPGAIVLDAGAGTGFLSLLAAKAGAGHVYAVERTAIADFAAAQIERNHLSEKISLVRGNILEVDLPSKVDVIVSEWMGGVGIDENMYQSLLITRDRWLKPGGKMVPEVVTAYLAPVFDKEVAKQFALWRSDLYGVDLSMLAEQSAQEIFSEQHHINGDSLLSAPQQLWENNALTDTAERAGKLYEANLSFTVEKDSLFNGVAGWFNAKLFGGITLTNAPDAPRNHWGRYVFPTNAPCEVSRGTQINVRFAIEPSEALFPVHYWDIQVGENPWEKHASSHVTAFSDILCE